MRLWCWLVGHDPYHPRANAEGRLVATCRRCDTVLALDLTTDVGRPRVTQPADRAQLRLGTPLRLLRRRTRVW